jgi:hypothetical protein
LDGITIPCTEIGQPEPVRQITAADDFITMAKRKKINGSQNYLSTVCRYF